MVELFEKDIIETGIRSSKGNQLKWRAGDIWYKADYAGYEALSEIITSRMMDCSDLKKDEFVLYDFEKIKYKANSFNGCRSKNFIKNGQQLITLERLYKSFYGESLYVNIYKIANVEDRFDYLVRQTERMTGIKGFAIYLNKVLTVDAISLNEDRHMHNIAVILNHDGTYSLCPIFDQGAGLLSDTTLDYPLGEDPYKLIDTVKAKTISDVFDEQLDISEKHSHSQMHFSFTKADVISWLADEDLVSNYSSRVLNRVEKVVLDRMRKYQYLFS